MECRCCGTCCTAPDIAYFKKPMGIPCHFLGSDYTCRIYDDRPSFCRGYEPDDICRIVAAPTLEERVEKYLKLFGCR